MGLAVHFRPFLAISKKSKKKIGFAGIRTIDCQIRDRGLADCAEKRTDGGHFQKIQTTRVTCYHGQTSPKLVHTGNLPRRTR